MEYVQTKAPYLRHKKSTLQIMIELGIALAVIWVLAVVTTYVKMGGYYGTRAILLMVVSIAVTLVCDVLVTILKNKKDKTLGKKISYDLVHNYSWITAAIFTLCCPVWTSYYEIITGSIFATMIGKHVFGGFGKNIFNPAAMGRIFVALCFDLSVPAEIIGYVQAGSVTGFDLSTGATVANNFNSTQAWLGSNALASFKPLDLLAGTYFGAMGETFTIALIVIGVILAVRGVIQWRAPAFYLGTVALSALVVSLVLGFNNPGLYVLYHLSIGGVVFGAVFMITDPVTTPTSPYGNCLVGILAGLLTVLIRVGTKSPEGVVYSLAIVNLVSPMIDGLITGKTSDKNGLKCGITFGSVALSIALITGVAWNANGGREVYTINGMKIEEYNYTVEKLNMRFLDEGTGYSIAPYSKTIDMNDATTAAALRENPDEAMASAYTIIKDKKEVGVIYLVGCGKKINIPTAEGYSQDKSAQAYIAILPAEHKVLGITYLSVTTVDADGNEKVTVNAPCVGDNFISKVTKTVSEFDYINEDFTALAPTDICTGASYSIKGTQDVLIPLAFSFYESQFAA